VTATAICLAVAAKKIVAVAPKRIAVLNIFTVNALSSMYKICDRPSQSRAVNFQLANARS